MEIPRLFVKPEFYEKNVAAKEFSDKLRIFKKLNCIAEIFFLSNDNVNGIFIVNPFPHHVFSISCEDIEKLKNGFCDFFCWAIFRGFSSFNFFKSILFHFSRISLTLFRTHCFLVA